MIKKYMTAVKTVIIFKLASGLENMKVWSDELMFPLVGLSNIFNISTSSSAGEFELST